MTPGGAPGARSRLDHDGARTREGSGERMTAFMYRKCIASAAVGISVLAGSAGAAGALDRTPPPPPVVRSTTHNCGAVSKKMCFNECMGIAAGAGLLDK